MLRVPYKRAVGHLKYANAFYQGLVMDTDKKIMLEKMRHHCDKALHSAIAAMHSPINSLMDLKDVIKLQANICEIMCAFEPPSVISLRLGVTYDNASRHAVA